MQVALDTLYYIFEKFLNFMFTTYIFDGVSLGMLFIASYIFVVLLRFLVAIPRLPVGDSEMRDARLDNYRASAESSRARTDYYRGRR